MPIPARFRLFAPALIALTLCAVVPAAALASFPGKNGPIAVVVAPPSDPAGIPESQLPKIELLQPGASSGPAPVRGFAPAWSADGMRVAYDCATICIANADGSNVQHVAGAQKYDGGPSWSPDGQHLVFTRVVRRTLTTQLWIADLATGTVRRLTHPTVNARVTTNDMSPAWSPDGSVIVFARALQKFNRAGVATLDRTDLWAIAPDGSGALPLLTSRPGFHAGSPEWSPDSTRVAFVREPNKRAIGTLPYYLTISTGAITAIPAPKRTSVGDLSWSPDGTMIAMEAVGAKMYAGITCTVTFATGARLCPSSADALTSPAWQPVH